MSGRLEIGDKISDGTGRTVIYIATPNNGFGERRGTGDDFAVVEHYTSGAREDGAGGLRNEAVLGFCPGGEGEGDVGWWVHMTADDLMNMARLLLRKRMTLLARLNKGDDQ